MMVPNDIHMLVSYLNTKLRDDDMSIDNLLEVNDIDQNDFYQRLESHQYYFDEETNQIKPK